MSKIYSNKIIRIAKSWLGTKFHYYGRVKKNQYNNGGIDCIGFILKVGEEVDSTYNGKNIIEYDYNYYSKYPNNGEMKKFLDKYFEKIDEKNKKNGDLVYLNFQNNLEHIAVINEENLIHCYIEVGKIVEHFNNDYWKTKIVAFYRYPKK